MCENLPHEIIKKGELPSNLLSAKSQKVYVSFQEWKTKKGIAEVTEDAILAFIDMRVRV